jgi:hypothetical protein
MKMKTFVVQASACCVLILSSACGKKPSTATTPDNTPAAATAPAGADGNTAAAAETDYSKTLDRLTQAVRKYAAETRSVPKSLNELVAAGYLPEIPTPPAGKQFVIDDQLRVRLK